MAPGEEPDYRFMNVKNVNIGKKNYICMVNKRKTQACVTGVTRKLI
jgi:hypothetical protein